MACGSASFSENRGNGLRRWLIASGRMVRAFTRDHVLLILQLAFDQQKLFIDHHLLELLINSGRNDGVGDARLIFDAEKDETLGGAGTLAGDDRIRRCAWCVRGAVRQVRRRRRCPSAVSSAR